MVLRLDQDALAGAPAELVAFDTMIDGVAFDGYSTCFFDQSANARDGECFGSGGAGVVIDQFVDDGSIEVVGPEGEGDLRDANPQHDPIRLDVGEVVEHQPADGDVAQVSLATGLFDVVHLRVIGVEGERDEGLESAGLVLKRTKTKQVIDAVLGGFEMAVKHRGVAVQAEPVSLAMNFDPAIGVGLVLTEFPSNGFLEDFRSAAGKAAEAGFLQFFEDFANRELGDASEPVDFDGGVGLQVNLGKVLADDTEDVLVPVEVLLMMQAADNVHFGGAPFVRLAGVSMICSSLMT